jgi:hypothetical protein
VILRPNAIDHRVDHLSAHTLLTHSAAQLVDPYRQVAAARLVHWWLPGWFLAVLVPAFLLAYYWQSGRAAQVRDLLRKRFGNEWLVRFLWGAILALVIRVAGLIPNLYLYRVERAMEQSDQLLRSWGSDWIAITLLWMLVIGLVTAAVLWLVERTHQWYLYTLVAILAVNFGIAYLTPQVQHRPPYVAGPAELQYVIARQAGYIETGSRWRFALTDALLLIVGAAIAVIIADRIGFRRDDDPVSRLALVAALCCVLYIVAAPIENLVHRGVSRDAERYALQVGVDRAAAVRSVVRTTDQSLGEVCPGLLARVFMLRIEDPSNRIFALNGVPPNCK